MTIRKQEVAGLTLQQAYSIQEQLNSEMAIADSKLRKVEARNDEQFRKDYPLAVGTDYEEQAKKSWYAHRPYTAGGEQTLRENKKNLEEVYCILCDHIENLTIS